MIAKGDTSLFIHLSTGFICSFGALGPQVMAAGVSMGKTSGLCADIFTYTCYADVCVCVMATLPSLYELVHGFVIQIITGDLLSNVPNYCLRFQSFQEQGRKNRHIM